MVAVTTSIDVPKAGTPQNPANKRLISTKQPSQIFWPDPRLRHGLPRLTRTHQLLCQPASRLLLQRQRLSCAETGHHDAICTVREYVQLHQSGTQADLSCGLGRHEHLPLIHGRQVVGVEGGVGVAKDQQMRNPGRGPRSSCADSKR